MENVHDHGVASAASALVRELRGRSLVSSEGCGKLISLLLYQRASLSTRKSKTNVMMWFSSFSEEDCGVTLDVG
jgi:hypothetical protein